MDDKHANSSITTKGFQLITIMREFISFSLNGRATSVRTLVKNKTAHVLSSSNHCSVTELTSHGIWFVHFNDGNTNNNNKNNSSVGRVVSALGEEEIISWIKASDDCCKHKKTSYQCTMYRIREEEILPMLVLAVHEGTYAPLFSECFVVRFPKLREIFAANFLDRIVQHWIILRIEPLLEELFVSTGDVSFNCRKGYGTLRAVRTFSQKLDEVTLSWIKDAYIGRFDLQSFFMSINKGNLWSMLRVFIQDNYFGDDKETLLWLSETTIMHRPQDNCVRKGDISLWDKLPVHKSLFTMDGMAIGNITSQILANFNLNKFDEMAYQFCKERGGWYQRFVDDMTVILPTIKDVIDFFKMAQEFLERELYLTLHPDKVYIQHAKKGVKFIGSVVMPGRIYLSNRTVSRLYDMLQEMERFINSLNLRNVSIDDAFTLEHYVCSCNSYMGFLKYNNSYALRRRLFGNLSYFWKVAYVSGHFDKVTLRKRFMVSTKVLKLHNCQMYKNKDYGNKVFRGISRKSGSRKNKTHA